MSATATAAVREYEFDLPVGYVDEDGKLERTAVVRKMTGRDEAILVDRQHRHNAARMVTELLASCLVRLGDLARPGTKVVQQLYSADRHFLLVKLREITFGPEMQASYACPTCRESTQIVEDLAELPVNRLGDCELPGDISVELEDGYVDRDGGVHRTAVFRHPRGLDEERVASLTRDNASKGKNALMTRCLTALGDLPENRRDALGTAIFNDLTLGDRALIESALNGDGPGVRLRRDLTCGSCGREFRATLDMTNFLTRS